VYPRKDAIPILKPSLKSQPLRKGRKKRHAMKNLTVLKAKGDMLSRAIFTTGNVEPQIKATRASPRSA